MYPVDIPEDVVRDILELAAYSSFAQAAILAQVSHVVHAWIKPILYRTFICHLQYWHGPPSGELNWFIENGKYIKNLYFGIPTPEVATYLSYCPNVTNLSIAHIPGFPMSRLLPTIAKMPLTRLSAPITTLIPSDRFTLEQLEDSPMFQTLTHLDITGYCTSLASYHGDLPNFPNLTHVSVPICACSGDPVHGLLMKYPRLRVVALLEEMTSGCLPLAGKKLRKRCASPEDLCLIPTQVPFVSSDPRVVALKCDFLSNWELAAQQGCVEGTLWDRVDRLAGEAIRETH